MTITAGRHYEDWIEAVVQISDSVPSAAVFRRWAALSAVAGALGRKCWYDHGAYQLSPNLFIALIGEPASGKTVSLVLPYYLVFRKLSVPLSMRDVKQGEGSWIKYGLERPFRLGKDRITPESIVVDMATNLGHVDWDLADFDADELPYNSSATIIVPEFGTFMRRTFEGLPTFLTAMWDHAPDYVHGTRGDGTVIIKGPCLNWISCAVPTEFSRNLPENAQEQGLLSRIIPVCYDGPSYDQSLETRKYPKEDVKWLCEDLAKIGNIRGQFTWADQKLFERENAWVQEGMQPRSGDPKMRFYNQRRMGHMIKMSMAISAGRRDDRVIREEDWETAKVMLLGVERTMSMALQMFGMSEVGHISRDLEEYLKAHKNGIKPSRLQKYILSTARGVNEMLATMEALRASGIITEKDGLIFPGQNIRVSP